MGRREERESGESRKCHRRLRASAGMEAKGQETEQSEDSEITISLNPFTRDFNLHAHIRRYNVIIAFMKIVCNNCIS